MATNTTKVQQSTPLLSVPLFPLGRKLHTKFVSILAWPKYAVFFLLYHFSLRRSLALASVTFQTVCRPFVCVCVLLFYCVCVLRTVATLNKLPQHLLAFHAKTLSLKFFLQWNLSWCVCLLRLVTNFLTHLPAKFPPCRVFRRAFQSNENLNFLFADTACCMDK